MWTFYFLILLSLFADALWYECASVICPLWHEWVGFIGLYGVLFSIRIGAALGMNCWRNTDNSGWLDRFSTFSTAMTLWPCQLLWTFSSSLLSFLFLFTPNTARIINSIRWFYFMTGDYVIVIVLEELHIRLICRGSLRINVCVFNISLVTPFSSSFTLWSNSFCTKNVLSS